MGMGPGETAGLPELFQSRRTNHSTSTLKAATMTAPPTSASKGVSAQLHAEPAYPASTMMAPESSVVAIAAGLGPRRGATDSGRAPRSARRAAACASRIKAPAPTALHLALLQPDSCQT